MATSGVADFDLDLVELIEEAGERCGYEIRSGYDFRTARRSLNLLFADWANRGLNLWTLEQGTIPLVAGTASYDLPADTVDLLEAVIRTGTGTSQADIIMPRISASVYASIPNKNQRGRPYQMWIDRQIVPRVTLWQVPDQTNLYTFVYWRLKRIQNAGDGPNTQALPFRFLPAMVAGLAYYLALKVPGGLDRLSVLKTQYDEAWMQASDEDREKAPVRLVPRMGF